MIKYKCNAEELMIIHQSIQYWHCSGKYTKLLHKLVLLDLVIEMGKTIAFRKFNMHFETELKKSRVFKVGTVMAIAYIEAYKEMGFDLSITQDPYKDNVCRLFVNSLISQTQHIK